MSLFQRAVATIRRWFGIDWIREARQVAQDARSERYEPTGNPISDRYRGITGEGR